jgi:two-component system NarL family sensor kinase
LIPKLTCALLCSLPLLLIAQNARPVLDSLEKVAAGQTDSTLVKTYNELTWQYRNVNRDKAINYGRKALTLAGEVNYQAGVAQAYNDLGILYFDNEQYDSALLLYKQSATIRERLNDRAGMAGLYNKIGILYQKQGILDEALDAQLKALSLYEALGNNKGISYSLTNIGILQQNLGRYAEAISYQERAVALKEKTGDQYGLAGSFVNLANVYVIKKEYTRAESYYQKALDICRKLDDKEYLSSTLNNLGNLYLTMNEGSKAIPLINESLQLRRKMKDTKGIVSCLNNLGDIYTTQGQYDTAYVLLQEALRLARPAVNCRPELQKVYLSLSSWYEKKGDPVKALEMYKYHAAYKDSLFSDDLGDRFAELETRFRMLEKEKTIQQQHFDLQQKEFSITRRNYWIAGISGLLLLGGLLAYSGYRRYRLKQKAAMQQALLQQQDIATRAVMEAEEEERKRIARDLHDGVGQMMSAAKMNLSAFEAAIPESGAEQKQSLNRIIGLVDESCREIRHVSHNMMPHALLKNNLAEAVRDFVEKIDKNRLHVHLYTEGLEERIDANVETVFYRVLQECVNNVIKHAGATTLDISLIRDKDGISATIEDNGKGFDTSRRGVFDGIGLKNIVTRVEYLRGTVDFDSAPGRGTLIAIHIPIG